MRAACAATPRSGAARLASALAKFPGWAAHGTSSNDAPHTTSVVGTNATSIACRSRGEASRGTKPNVNSFQFACLLSLGIMLVFTGFLPPTSPRAHDTSDKLSAQGGRFASGGEAASFQVLGISCVAYPALAQLPTCLAPRAGASSCFDATRGFPGEGPKTNSPERNDGNFTSESAAAGTNADQLRIANEVGCKVFGELWGEMACRITGTDVKKMCTLSFKCRCTPSQPAAAGSAVKEERTLEDLKVLLSLIHI